jgi:hypothetical protein
MRSLLIIIFSMLLISCGLNQYKGTNAGYVVMGIGSAKEIISFPRFTINKLDATSSRFSDVMFQNCKTKSWTGACKPDYDNATETGIVSISRLEPGDYVIGWFETQVGDISMKNKEYLGIRFTIKPNQTTYIGNYQTIISTSKTLWWKSPKGVSFILTNRKDQDIAYAKINYPEIPSQNVISTLPDTNTISGKIYFINNNQDTPKP